MLRFVVVNVNDQVWTRWRNPNMQFSKWASLGGTVWHGNPENDGSWSTVWVNYDHASPDC